MHKRLFSLFIIIIATCFVLASCESHDPETINEKDVPVGTTYAMWELIESGKMTEGQVLVATLQVLADEKTSAEVFGDTKVAMEEGTTLFLIARSYLKYGKDPKAKAEIKRLLAILTTNVEILRRPDKTSSLGDSGHDNTNSTNRQSLFSSLISQAQAADSECRAAWNRGNFEDEARHCWKKIEWFMHGYEYIVHYPKIWESGSKEYQHVEAAVEGIQKAVNKYRTFGKMYKVYFVFTLKQPKALIPENETKEDQQPTWLALTEFQPVMNLGRGRSNPTPWCIVQSYTTYAMKGLETNRKKKYQQAVAHELWHCFQAWHLYPQFYQGHEGGKSAKWERATEWWVEGSAEYYSNLVYPKVNIEHRNINGFDKNSLKYSILQLSFPYESFGFFQFLANQPGMGAEGVLRFLKSLPSEGGFKEQADAVARFGDMKKTFNQFGRDYLDGKIEDTGGGFIPFEPKFGKEIRINKPGKYRVNAKQFRLERRQLIFNSGWQFNLKTHAEGAPGKDNSKEPPEESWGHLPESITTGCSKRKYNLLLTSADESAFGQKYKFNIDVESGVKTQTRRAKVDKCLVGTWKMQNPSHDSIVKSMVNKAGMNMGFKSSGLQTVHFSKGCKSTLTLKDYKTKSTVNMMGMSAKITSTSNGTDTADYIAAGGVITFSNWKQGMCERSVTTAMGVSVTTIECGPDAKGKAGKRQTIAHTGGKSYDMSKMFRDKKSGRQFDMNQFLKQHRKNLGESGMGKYARRDYGSMMDQGMPMPMGKAEKEPSLFAFTAEYKCRRNKLTLRAIAPTTSAQAWELRRIKP